MIRKPLRSFLSRASLTRALLTGAAISILAVSSQAAPQPERAQPERAQPGSLKPGSPEHLAMKLRAADLQKHQLQAATKGIPQDVLCEANPDFVVTGSSSSSTVNEHCFPNAAGTFAPRADIHGLSIVDGMDVADMDNDGDNDFLACDGLTTEVYLYTQDPSNTFTPTTVASGVTPGGGSFLCTYLRIADFNGDNLNDFIVGDHLVAGGMYVYLQGPAGSFTPQSPGLDLTWASPTGAQCNCVFGVAAGDVDGDGNDDVMLLGFNGQGAGQVWFYQGDGFGGMATPTLKFDLGVDFPVVANPTGLALFDVEGDGDLDVIAGGSFDGSHYIYTNDGVAGFTAPAGPAFSIHNYSGIDSYDVDGDQDEDLMLVDWTSRRLLLSENINGAMAAPVAVGVVDGPSLGVGAPERPEKSGFDLDHFKCYPAEAEKPVNEEIVLTDQFNTSDVAVYETRHFCNAVTKIHDEVMTPIQNEDAHLEMIRIQADGDTPSQVEVTNQFGKDQKLDIGKAAYLAVPTQKIEPGNHPFPERLDHFKCYEVYGDSEAIKVSLKDQFGFEEGLEAIVPLLLCNPTKKEHAGNTTPIENPLDHLVCYELDLTEQIFDNAYIRNQFGERGLKLDRADMLCLPSEKRVIR